MNRFAAIATLLTIFSPGGVLRAGSIISLATAEADLVGIPGQATVTQSSSGPNSAGASLNEDICYHPNFPASGGCGLLTAQSNATAQVTYGYINLSASVFGGYFTDDAPIGPFGTGSASASASFSDSMTILGGTGTANLQWYLEDTSFSSDPTTIQISSVLPTQVTYGVPFDISASGLIESPVDLRVLGGGSASAVFDILGMRVNGSNDYQYGTATDTNYYIGGTFVEAPEPSYLWIFAAIAGVVVLRNSRWVRASHPAD